MSEESENTRPPGKWVRGLASPNPAGRPKGAAARKRERIVRALNDDGPDVVRVVIDKALEGDMTAAGLVLSRLTPPVRAQAEKIRFDFAPGLPIGRQIEAVPAAVAAGEVPPDLGQQVISMIGTLSNARATEELAERLAILEARAI
ncbi:DUF5681 domain-containing protein [Paracoccus sp. IB05]|uniref:DUF5681 domain-containing protein n=1 Tax=Paracoccus sp. IB05 TaxID=2779367 RepID=UPI00351C429B